MSSFKDLRIVDNFYQSSAFFPMPTVLISTLDDEGKTTIGAYSLIFPYYIAGKDYYAMILEARNSSNTAQNILKRGKCALNFLEDSYKDFQATVKLGFPGQTPAEKMKNLPVGTREGPSRREEAARHQESLASLRMHLGRHPRGRLQGQGTGWAARRGRTPVPELQRHHLEVRLPLHPQDRQDPHEGEVLQRHRQWS